MAAVHGDRWQRRAIIQVAGAALALPALSHAARAQPAGPIRLGALVSVTGADAINGFNGLAGVRMAVAEINASGGINGRRLELVIGDDQGDPTAAVNEARRLLFQERAQILVGPQSSQRALAILPILNQARIATVATIGANELTPSAAPAVFSINPSSEAQALAMANHVARVLRAPTVASLTDNGAQAKAGMVDLRRALQDLGVRLTGEQEFGYRSEDKTPQLLALRRGAPKALIIWANTPEDYGGLLNNLEQIGWDDVPIVGAVAQTMLAVPATRIARPAQFARVAGVAYVNWTYCPGQDLAQNAYVAFRQRLQAFERARFRELAPTVAAFLYDGVLLLKAAIEGSGTTDGTALAGWIRGHAGTVPAVSGRLEGSEASNFLVQASGLTMAMGVATPSPEGLFRRAAC